MAYLKTILIADDDPAIRRALKRAFEDPRYRVVCAEDGTAALQAAQDQTPDMIILDVNMPGMDGPDVLARLRKEDLTKNIPTVFMTARIEHLSRINRLRLRANNFFEKPFDLLALKDRVEEILWGNEEQDVLTAETSQLY